jgi:hypothetical protein
MAALARDPHFNQKLLPQKDPQRDRPSLVSVKHREVRAPARVPEVWLWEEDPVAAAAKLPALEEVVGVQVALAALVMETEAQVVVVVAETVLDTGPARAEDARGVAVEAVLAAEEECKHCPDAPWLQTHRP